MIYVNLMMKCLDYLKSKSTYSISTSFANIFTAPKAPTAIFVSWSSIFTSSSNLIAATSKSLAVFDASIPEIFS